MAFPTEPRTVLTELKVGSTDWANISGDVLLRDSITITRGQAGEATQSAPGTLNLSLNNKLGRYSPRNPLSPLYGLVGRNTPIRVSLPAGTASNSKYGMVIGTDSSLANGRAQCPDSAGLSSGDLDIRLDLQFIPRADGVVTGWVSGSHDLASHFDFVVNHLDWSFMVINGVLRLRWYPTGTTPGNSADSTVAVGVGAHDRLAVRATLDLDNGAAGRTITFYTAPTLAGPWTVLGAPVVQAGVTSRFDSGAPLRIGAGSQQGASPFIIGTTDPCVHYKAEIRQGIDGTVVASPDFTAQPLDPVPFSGSAFNDAQGNFFTFSGSADAARIWYGDVDVRFHGEIGSLPNRWDTSGNDAWVPIEAAGILRRLGQGTEPAAAGLRDWVLSQMTTLTSYFPLSGAEGTQYSLNLGRVGPNQWRFYPENYGSNPVFTYGRDMGSPILGTGMELNATGFTSAMRGDVVAGDSNFALDFVFQSPAMGELYIEVWDYDYKIWTLVLQDPADTGKLHVEFDAPDTGPVAFTAVGPFPALQDDTRIHTCRFAVTQNGANLDYKVYLDGTLVDFGTMAGYGWNGTAMYRFFYSRYAGQTIANLAHLTLWSHPTVALVPTAADFHSAAMGYAGETVGARMTRITGLAGIPFELEGTAADTTIMGPQYSEAKLTQMRDAEATDLGILFEGRAKFGLKYRTRVSMANQAPAFTLSYTAGQIGPPLEPVDDDTSTRNDITTVRREGDSYRLQQTTGKLSVSDPPAGVGRYHDEVTVNVQTDAQLVGIANWLLSLGTLDAARYPVVTVDLHTSGVSGAAGLDAAIRAADVGDLLVLTAMGALGIYDDVELLILGYTETISDGAFKHTIKFNCTPYAIYNGGVYGSSISSGDDRYDTNGSALNAAVTSSDTSLSVKATGGTLWTQTAAAFPFDIMVGGERITVQNITGATSPQTFGPVVRSVNGVVKSHAADTDVRLYTSTRYTH